MSDEDQSNELYPRRIKSFVLRQGRITKGQRQALQEHWQQYGLQIEDGMLPLEKLFGGRPLILEIGFGNGESLVDMAQQQDHNEFIGIEVHRPGVGKIIADARNKNIKNLKVYCADAAEVLKQCIPDKSLDRVQIFFPDPWHKRRHHKRRLIQGEFIDLVINKLKPGGRIHVATDWQHYAEQVVTELKINPQLKNMATDSDYCPRPSYRHETKFERRGLKLGHGIWDIVFQKLNQ